MTQEEQTIKDYKLMKKAFAISLKSDDVDGFKVGAIVEFASNTIATGYTKIPRGLKATKERCTRPDKYKWLIHAEAALIASHSRKKVCHFNSMEYTTMAVTFFPCATCAGLIVEAGVTRLVVAEKAYLDRKDDPHYSFDVARAILEEAKVEIVWWKEVEA